MLYGKHLNKHVYKRLMTMCNSYNTSNKMTNQMSSKWNFNENIYCSRKKYKYNVQIKHAIAFIKL